MKLFNSLTKKTEELEPLHDNIVGLYSCGPTVYNNLHIGNLSAFIYADTLRRALQTQGYTVKHVMNITDVDDKTIRDSKRDYPKEKPETALKLLTDKYTKIFMDDMKATGVDTEAIIFISAVETIPEMIQLTQQLLDNDIAYIADDGVYFSITKYYQKGHTYGVLQKVATQQSKARVANDEYDKESASDFALWKKSLPGEPSWPADFSEDLMVTSMPGRPGWHIECSAMSQKTLGIPFDIHTGGIDLKFPHHENEIAQTCGAGNEKLSQFFFHNNHILVDGKKMSKSLGNVYTLRDVEVKGFTPFAFRLLVLESHYHSESNFSWDILQAAHNRYNNWLASADTMWQLPESDDTSVIEKVNDAMADNVNTPLVLKTIDSYLEKVLAEGTSPNRSVIVHIENVLGIPLVSKDIPKKIKDILEKRSKARQEKDWKTSDALREELLSLHIQVRDDVIGQIWTRIQS